MVDTALAKIGYGGRFDVLFHTEFHKKPFWTDYDTYQYQLVFSIEAIGVVIWEWFGFYRQQIELDLSLLQIKPIFI